MNKLIEPEDVIAVIKSFLDINTGDEATEDLLLAVGAELLDVSSDTMSEMVSKPEVNVLEAALLSEEEAKTLLTQQERAYKDGWWLCSPGECLYSATSVLGNGFILSSHNVCYVNDRVRPALRIDISNSDIKVGDTFEFGGIEFKVISPELAWMYRNDIGSCAFREEVDASDANVYSASDVKKYIDRWFESVKN